MYKYYKQILSENELENPIDHERLNKAKNLSLVYRGNETENRLFDRETKGQF